MKIAVKNLQNKDTGQVDLDETIFGVEVKDSVLHRMVHYQQNKRRAGTHKAQTRAEVTGTGAKPWRQKGTGRARAGDLKRPQDRGGGVAFGPLVRDHGTELPKKIRRLALKMALSAKNKNGKLVVLDDAVAESHKTKPMAGVLTDMGLDNALIVSGEAVDPNFARATRNIPHIDVLPSQGANVYDILRRDKLVLTKQAVTDLTQRLKG